MTPGGAIPRLWCRPIHACSLESHFPGATLCLLSSWHQVAPLAASRGDVKLSRRVLTRRLSNLCVVSSHHQRCPVVLVCPLGGAPYPPISPELTPCIILGLPAGGNICCCCPPCIIWEPIIMGCSGCTCLPAQFTLLHQDICCMLLRRSPIAGRASCTSNSPLSSRS